MKIGASKTNIPTTITCSSTTKGSLQSIWQREELIPDPTYFTSSIKALMVIAWAQVTYMWQCKYLYTQNPKSVHRGPTPPHSPHTYIPTQWLLINTMTLPKHALAQELLGHARKHTAAPHSYTLDFHIGKEAQKQKSAPSLTIIANTC